MRVLAGIWLVQAFTGLLFWCAPRFVDPLELARGGALAIGIVALAALWIRGIPNA